MDILDHIDEQNDAQPDFLLTRSLEPDTISQGFNQLADGYSRVRMKCVWPGSNAREAIRGRVHYQNLVYCCQHGSTNLKAGFHGPLVDTWIGTG